MIAIFGYTLSSWPCCREDLDVITENVNTHPSPQNTCRLNEHGEELLHCSTTRMESAFLTVNQPSASFPAAWYKVCEEATWWEQTLHMSRKRRNTWNSTSISSSYLFWVRIGKVISCLFQAQSLTQDVVSPAYYEDFKATCGRNWYIMQFSKLS